MKHIPGYLLDMKEKWPSSVVSRHEIERFTGGLLRARHLSNLDAKGEGIAKVRLGRRVAYKVDDVLDFLASRLIDEGRTA